ncbi:MAG: hypothetical protein ACRD22_15605, partial [Terriglobia bacterium]
HPNFYFAPATGQLSSKHPSAVIIPKHGPSANGFRRCLRTPGRVMVEFDFKSFHAMTLGFEANCPAYMRAAGLDIHSLVSGECFKIHRMDQILGRSDQEIREYCEWYKSDPARKHHRDKKAKPAILGIGFGLGDRKLFMMNRDSFANLREAQMVKEVIKGLFPEIFTFQENIRRLATKQCHLISRWGYIRWFWAMERYDTHRRVMVPGEDSEAAIAFLPANDAFGVIRAVIVELARLGLDEKFSLVNTIHDSLIFNPLPEQVDELIAEVKPIMEQPWTRLISEIVPDGLVCRVDVARGESLGEME